MRLTLLILIVSIVFQQSNQNECICQCCLDDNLDCIPTFYSSIHLNSLDECNQNTCNQEMCLTFSQCSLAFGKINAACGNIRSLPSSSTHLNWTISFKPKVAPVVPLVNASVTTQPVIPEIEKKNKPYGYIRLFAGVKTGENAYSTPIISLHTYNRGQKQIHGNTTASTTTTTPNVILGSATSSNVRKQETDEKVRCIPIEDIISISYSTDVKKEFETIETKRERPPTPKAKLSCCGRVKECCVETCCRFECCPCKCCRRPPPKQPRIDTTTKQNVTAKRMILIEMRFVRYTNIHIPSHIEALSEQKKKDFIAENFHTDKIEFYLVNNTDKVDDDFTLKSQQAEELICLVTQLRNMHKKYPSPRELEEILQQHQAALYGDEIQH